MDSNYSGVSVVRDDAGMVFAVNVVDDSGLSNELAPEEYNQRALNPPIALLPTYLASER